MKKLAILLSLLMLCASCGNNENNISDISANTSPSSSMSEEPQTSNDITSLQDTEITNIAKNEKQIFSAHQSHWISSNKVVYVWNDTALDYIDIYLYDINTHENKVIYTIDKVTENYTETTLEALSPQFAGVDENGYLTIYVARNYELEIIKINTTGENEVIASTITPYNFGPFKVPTEEIDRYTKGEYTRKYLVDSINANGCYYYMDENRRLHIGNIYDDSERIVNGNSYYIDYHNGQVWSPDGKYLMLQNLDNPIWRDYYNNIFEYENPPLEKEDVELISYTGELVYSISLLYSRSESIDDKSTKEYLRFTQDGNLLKLTVDRANDTSHINIYDLPSNVLYEYDYNLGISQYDIYATKEYAYVGIGVDGVGYRAYLDFSDNSNAVQILLEDKYFHLNNNSTAGIGYDHLTNRFDAIVVK